MFHVKHPADWEEAGFGIYVHWPFCQSKCPYCDFNSHVAATIDQRAWTDAYLRDLDRAAEETAGRYVSSVFFGGGTPSLMQPEVVAAILDRIRRHWRPRNDWEVTLEANPGSADASRFSGYRDAGVNRVSIGVQSLREDALAALGRRHNVAEARAAVDLALSVFPAVSADLIYARQHQAMSDWSAELRDAIAMETQHLSVYQLTIEPRTAFHDRLQAGGLRGLPDEDLAADLYLATQEICEAAGLPAYEVSNHARNGFASIHNAIYWRAGDYLGIGPGAHGRLTVDGARWATEAASAPGAWLDAVRNGQRAEARDLLSRTEQIDEFILMGMRMSDGIDLARLERLSERSVDSTQLLDLCELGVTEVHGGRLRTTPKGRLVLNRVIAEVSSAYS